MRGPRSILAAALLVVVLPGQRGDRAGEAQSLLPATVVVPPATPRSAVEELATFRVAPGFRVELFAAEPQVADPVAAACDSAGRLWVVEMRGYMNDLDARDELAANGRIVVLSDRDGDGRADASHVFADGLVLPRAVLPLRGGALMIAPPELVFFADADGDLRPESRTVVMGGFEAGLDNPEHAGNGLLWGFDHRIHLANDARLVRWTPAGFAVEPGAGGGQWGITHDDRGRCYFNYNEDWLRVDLVPGRHGPRAQATGGLPLLNHRVCRDRTVWPVRVTPGVNRGYQPGRLVDWVLAIHTAVCAPHVYRGGLLPCDGDVFVCEPAGNVVRRIVVHDDGGLLRGANVHEAERREFLASTDERFRPVHLLTGFDGALYVVDMYRGVIQHRNFVTTFLRRQIEARGLEQPIGRGRIWRIVPDGVAVRPQPSLHDAPAERLVAALLGDNGAVRDVALRELVQRRERTVLPALRDAARAAPRPAHRVAALAALAGLEALDATDLRAALRAADAGVVVFALQHAAPWLARGDRHAWLAAEHLVLHPAADVRWHLALALGDVAAGAAGASWRPACRALWCALLRAHGGDAALRGTIAAAAGDDLVAVLAQTATAAGDASWLPAAAADLAGRALRSRRAAMVGELFAWLAEAPEPLRTAALRGAVDALPKGAARPGWLVLPAPPRVLLELATRVGAGPEVAPLVNELVEAITVAGTAAPGAVAALSPAEQQRVRAGEAVFARACASCHQLDGNGMQGLAPPLRDSEWVLGDAERLTRIVLHGVRGPIDVHGVTWSLEMPGQRQLGDADIAAVLSYVRRAFGHAAAPVAVEAVAAVRAAHARRREPWTAAELDGPR